MSTRLLLTVEQFAEAIQWSRTSVEAEIEAGLPCLDFSNRTPGRREKRAIRIDSTEALTWLREHRRYAPKNGGGE